MNEVVKRGAFAPSASGGDDAEPQVGRVARDIRTQRVGLVLAIDGAAVRLRALATGRVWDAELPSVRRVSAREELNMRLAAANVRTEQAASQQGRELR